MTGLLEVLTLVVWLQVAKSSVWPPSRRGPMASVLSEGHVYIRDALGAEELYDVAADRDERYDLSGSEVLRPILERSRTAYDRLVPAGRGHP